MHHASRYDLEPDGVYEYHRVVSRGAEEEDEKLLVTEEWMELVVLQAHEMEAEREAEK